MNASLLARAWALPLTRMLLLSCGLHLALIMAVRPRPFPAMDQTVVIDARLEKEVVATVVAEAVAATSVETSPPPTPVADPAPLPIMPVPADSPHAPPPLPAAPSQPVPVRPAAAAAPPLAESTVVPATAQAGRSPEPSRGNEPAAPMLPSIPVMIDPTWYEARQLDVSPKALRPIKPVYPAEAVRQGIQGTVKLMLRVDEFGMVREAEVLEGNPPGVFDESALEAFRNARFEAARRDRLPVRALIYIRVHYELND